jgi:catechol 2,3-dioxygenase-like lactoylglutathione lyase family enzyme
MTLRITGLDHIVLVCGDVETSIKFYCEELGLEPERVDEWRRGDAPFPSARIDACTIIDLFGASRDGRSLDGRNLDHRNLDHLCLTFEGATLDELSSRFPDGRRGDHLFGAQGYADSLYIHDPDGNTVELRSYTGAPPSQ